MSRMWGSCLDHVVEVEVVTADGAIQRANSTHNQDLFFVCLISSLSLSLPVFSTADGGCEKALRGAGAGFGVITEFVMRTHPEPGSVVQYTYDVTLGSTADVASVYETWQALIADPDLDRRFGSEFVIHPLGAIITGTFYGTKDEFQASGIADRLPKTGGGTLVVNDWLASLAHEAENEALYLSNLATHFYSKSLAFKPADLLPSAGIKDLFAYADTLSKGTLLWFIIFDASGGAVGDVPQSATAYAHRDKVMFYQSYAVGLVSLPDETKTFLTKFHEKLLTVIPQDTYGTYPGYVDPAIANPQEEYWMSNLPLLSQIKRKWDPSDIFHNPQSVRPATS